MIAKLLIPLNRVGGGINPVGYEEYGDAALFLVRCGAAEPADEECEKAHGLTPQQLREAQLGCRASAAGVWPEDMDLFREGVIAGYDLDGNYIPGPNYVEPEEPDEGECEDE